MNAHSRGNYPHGRVGAHGLSIRTDPDDGGACHRWHWQGSVFAFQEGRLNVFLQGLVTLHRVSFNLGNASTHGRSPYLPYFSMTPVYQNEITLPKHRDWQVCCQLTASMLGGLRIMPAYWINYGFYFYSSSAQWCFPPFPMCLYHLRHPCHALASRNTALAHAAPSTLQSCEVCRPIIPRFSMSVQKSRMHFPSRPRRKGLCLTFSKTMAFGETSGSTLLSESSLCNR